MLPYIYILFSLLASWWSSFRRFCCGRESFRQVRKWAGIGGWLKEVLFWSVWVDLPVPVVVFLYWPRVSFVGLSILVGRHAWLVEVSWGFQRLSLEGTLGFNYSSSVKEEEEAEVVRTYRIRFLLSSFHLCFIFLCCISFVLSFVFPWLSHTRYFYYVGMPLPLWLDYFCYIWPTLLRKASKRGWWISCGGALLDRVWLWLERGFAAVYSGPGECSAEVCLVPRTALDCLMASKTDYVKNRIWNPASCSQLMNKLTIDLK